MGLIHGRRWVGWQFIPVVPGNVVWLFLPYMVLFGCSGDLTAHLFSPNGHERALVPLRNTTNPSKNSAQITPNVLIISHLP